MSNSLIFFFCILFLFWKSIEGNDSWNGRGNIPFNDDEESKNVPTRIVNGTKAILGQFPQQVSLRRIYSQSHFCGGSILAPEWVLTASHCMFDAHGKALEPYTILVFAGEVILKNRNNVYQWSDVKEIIIHPLYNPRTLHNDVTLLRLRKPFRFDPFVNAAPVARTIMPENTVCQVSGWGYRKHEANMVSPHLLYVDLPLMPKPLCRKLLWNITSLPRGMFCAGYREGGRDACQGDSGGGMLCLGRLTGVVSGGEGCAWPDKPGLYADIRVYLDWIENYVNLNEKYPVLAHPRPRSNSGSVTSLSLPFFILCLVKILYTVFMFI